MSAENFLPGVGTVYIANGLASADALAAGPVAGIEGAPILLAKKDSVPQAVKDELRRLAPSRIVVLGGTGSLSAPLEDWLSGIAPVTRWGGIDRYAVSAAIAGANFAPGVPVVFLANGLASADALAAGPVAALLGGPILLVRTDSMTGTVADELDRLDPARIVVLGGEASVSASLLGSLSEPLALEEFGTVDGVTCDLDVTLPGVYSITATCYVPYPEYPATGFDEDGPYEDWCPEALKFGFPYQSEWWSSCTPRVAQDAPVLADGTRVTYGGFACEVEGGGIACIVDDGWGYGFRVSNEAQSMIVP